MMKILAVCLLILTLACAAAPALAASPFAPGGGGGHSHAGGDGGDASVLSAALARIAAWQRTMRSELSAQVRTLKSSPSPWGLALFLGLSFAYGAVHAAGPGHGKSVAISYVLARGLSARRGAMLGALMGAAHAASAVVLVLGLHALARGAMMNRFEATAIWVERGSYALVACIGTWLVLGALRSLFGGGRFACCGGPEPGNADGPASTVAGSTTCRIGDGIESAEASPAPAPARSTGQNGGRNLFVVGLSTGLVPCPGAAIMLLFSLALDALWLGLAAVLAMACGMAATIALAAVLAVCCRGALASCTTRRPGLARAVSGGLALAGGLVVLGLGLMLLGGTLA